MSPVSAPSDRRFHRAHVKPVRRRRRWRRAALTILAGAAVLAGAGFGLYRLGDLVAHARVLEVDRIEVQGNERLSNDAVAAIVAGLRGENILRTDLELWRQRLMAAPWVSDASLRRALPSTIEIAITERRPIGFARIKTRLYLVDEYGVVIDQHGPAFADLDLPIIDGLALAANEEHEGRPYATSDPQAAVLAARVIVALNEQPAIGQRLSQVNVRDRHNAAVILTDEPARLYLGEDDFLARVTSYLEVASAVRETTPDIEYVDLRFLDDRMFVGPAREGRRVVPASAAGVRR